MRPRRQETLVVFIIGSQFSILLIGYYLLNARFKWVSKCVSKCPQNQLVGFFYGGSGVMEAREPVELQDRVQFPAIALTSVVSGHHHC